MEDGKYCRCHRQANIQKKKTVLKLDFYNVYCCKYVWVNKVVVGSGCGDVPKYMGEDVESRGLQGKSSRLNG